MQALRLLMLLVILVLAYLSFLRPHTNTDALPPDLAGSSQTASTPHSHNQYKEDMDRAQAAAKQMQAQRAEADAQ